MRKKGGSLRIVNGRRLVKLVSILVKVFVMMLVQGHLVIFTDLTTILLMDVHNASATNFGKETNAAKKVNSTKLVFLNIG